MLTTEELKALPRYPWIKGEKCWHTQRGVPTHVTKPERARSENGWPLLPLTLPPGTKVRRGPGWDNGPCPGTVNWLDPGVSSDVFGFADHDWAPAEGRLEVLPVSYPPRRADGTWGAGECKHAHWTATMTNCPDCDRAYNDFDYFVKHYRSPRQQGKGAAFAKLQEAVRNGRLTLDRAYAAGRTIKKHRHHELLHPVSQRCPTCGMDAKHIMEGVKAQLRQGGGFSFFAPVRWVTKEELMTEYSPAPRYDSEKKGTEAAYDGICLCRCGASVMHSGLASDAVCTAGCDQPPVTPRNCERKRAPRTAAIANYQDEVELLCEDSP